jgi:exo-1,4-beta-D-glucosaminidase
VIQWMLNNSWPSLIWHLYDYYLVPAGGYFGTKKATELVHVQYSYDDNSVAVVNSSYEAMKDVKVSAKFYSLDAKEKGSQEGAMNVAPDSSTKAFDLPKVEGLTTTYFLRLQLHDAAGKQLSDNFYWLSTKPDVLDWKHKKDTVYTPQAEFADLTGLNTLAQVTLDVKSSKEERDGKSGVRVSVHNPSGSLAFMVHLRVTKGKGGEDVTPIFWSDNYFSLLPGEQHEISASYEPSDLDGKAAVLEVDGYNVAAQSNEMH